MKSYLFIFVTLLVFCSYAQSTSNDPGLIIRSSHKIALLSESGVMLKGPYTIETNFSEYLLIRDGAKKRLIDPYSLETIMEFTTDTLVAFYTYPERLFMVSLNGKKGLYDSSKKVIIEPVYDEIYVNAYGLKPVFSVKKEDKYALFGRSGEIIFPFEYDEHISTRGDNFYLLKKEGKKALANKFFTIITPFKYDEFDYFEDGICKVKSEGKTGFINEAGKEVIALAEKDLAWMGNGLFSIEKTDDQYRRRVGLVDFAGKEVAPVIYSYIFKEKKGYSVSIENKRGMLNTKGAVIIPPIYNDLKYGSDSAFFIVTKNNLSGVIGDDGKIIVPPKYSAIGDFYQGKAVVVIGEKNGIVNKKWQLLVPTVYDNIELVDSTCYIYKKSGKYGLNYFSPKKKGIPAQYGEISYLRETNVFQVSKNDKWGILDRDGKVVLEPVYDEITEIGTTYSLQKSPSMMYNEDDQLMAIEDSSWAAGFFKVVKGGKHGLLNTKWNFVIPMEYDELRDFRNGVCIAKKGDLSFLIDTKNTVQFPKNVEEKYDVQYNPEGYLLAYQNKRLLVFDKTQTVIFDAVYDTVMTGFEGDLIVKSEGKYTLINSEGKVVVKNSVYPVTSCTEGFGVVKSYGDVLLVVDSTGKLIWSNKETSFEATNIGGVQDVFCLNKDLEEVYFYGNDWDYYFSLPSCFYELPKLKKIAIENSDYKAIPDDIAKLKQLHYLSISSQNFTSISPELGSLPLLDTLIFGIGMVDAIEFPDAIGELKKLRYLSIERNSLPTFPYLTSLTLRCDSLPSNIGTFKSLTNLELTVGMWRTNQEFSEELLEQRTAKIFSDLSAISGLKHLTISGNLNGNLAQTFLSHPEYLNKLKALKKIEISYLNEDDWPALTKAFPGITFAVISKRW